jgi:KipI family sensor histidine kinase inhibitor
MSGEGGSGGMRVMPAGPFGMMLEFDEAGGARRCYGLIEGMRSRGGVGGDGSGDGGRDSDIAGIVDVVPAERTVLVVSSFDAAGRSALRRLIGLLRDVDWTAAAVDDDGSESREVVLPVRYDGPDLSDVAELTGLSPAEVVRLHADAEFTVAFTGFAPGFAYLAGLPAALAVPRRDVPRTRVEAGAVGLAGPYSGVYPRASPGGWQIIGHLADEAEALWNPHRDPPALLQPGVRVRFRAETQADDE